MIRLQTRKINFVTLMSAALSVAFCITTSPAFAEMGVLAADQNQKFEELHTHYSPLSQERLQQLGISAHDYELRSQYGLMDYNSKFAHFNDLSTQRDGLIHEVAMYQADGHLKLLKARIEEEASGSMVARSALFLGTAYLFINGKTFSTHLTENVDLSGNAKLASGTHAFCLTRRNISPLGLSSDIGYQMEPDANPTLRATLSKEVAPHVIASVGQKRSLAGSAPTPTESTGEIRFGASF
ncbi:MAG: hypothetical protein ACJ763_19890 [Bdellovibrionia bacterium]